ncbi:MAG: PQQ-like beta-propeller repeat protein [Actinobacteria bacterium]|nr:PQQ-like beta-propeller repeat protein [Actinomycetota bacterium]
MADDPPAEPDPRPARAARWAAAATVFLLIVGTATFGVMASDPSGTPDDLDLLYPMELGTTWVYRVTSGGGETYLEVVRVRGEAVLPEAPGGSRAMVVEILDLSSPPSVSLQYLGRRGPRLLLLGGRSAGTHQSVTPAWEVARLPIEVGTSWTYEGEAFGLRYTSFRTEIVETGPVEAAGTTLDGCFRSENDGTIVVGEQEVTLRGTEWACPGVGTVSTSQEAPAVGFRLDKELLAVHGPAVDLAGPDPGLGPVGDWAEEPGGGPGLEPGRSNHRPEASLDPPRLLWTDAHSGSVHLPPAGDGERSVVVQEDGAVSALDLRTGEVTWRARLAGPIVAPPVLAGEVVLVADGAKSLFAIDAPTGATRWARRFPDLVSAAPLVTGGLVVAAGEDGVVRGLSLEDGEVRWEADVGAVVRAAPALASDGAVVVDEDGGIGALNLADGSTRWSASLEAEATAGPAVAGGLVLAGDTFGTLRALDAATGELRWTRRLAGEVEGVALTEDAVVALVDDSTLVVLEAATGEPRWDVAVPGRVRADPVVLGDEVLALSEEGRIHRHALADGRLLGSVEVPTATPGTSDTEIDMALYGGGLVVVVDQEDPWPNAVVALAAGPAPGAEGVWFGGTIRLVTPPVSAAGPRAVPIPDGDAVVFPDFDDVAWRVSLEAGGPIAALAETEHQAAFSIPVGDVLLFQDGPELLALPAGGGEPLWRFPMGEPFPSVAPAVDRDRVFVPIRGQGLAAVDLRTGEPLWFREVSGVGESSPLVLADGDVVYGVGGLVRLDGRTGAVEWRVDGVEAFGPLATHDGLIFDGAATDTETFLLAVDAATGREVWRAAMEPAVFVGPGAGSGVVVAVDGSAVAHAFDARTGRELWSMRMHTRPNGSPVVLGDFVVLSEQGRLEDLNERDHRVSIHELRTGRLLGSFEPSGSGTELPSVGAIGPRTIVLTDAGHLAFLDLRRLGTGS